MTSKITTIKQELSSKLTTLNRLSDNIEINNIVEKLLKEAIDAEFVSIWVYNFPLLTRIRKNKINEISVDKKKGLLYRCFATKQALIYNHISSAEGYVESIDNPDNIKIKSKIMIPLIYKNTFIGIATAYSSVQNVKKFSRNDLNIFQAIAPFVVAAVNKMKENTQYTSSQEAVVYSLKRENDVQQNLNENLNALEESLLDVKEPKEMIEYMSNIVHDIRTPANGLVGFLEILEEQIKDTRLKEYVGHAKNSALLINELTSSILDGVADKRESSSKEPTVVNTVKFFSDIAEMFSANMFKKNIHYNIFIDPLLPKEIEVNSMKTKRVIMNLIGNASKFTPENGSIEFSVRYKQKEKKLHLYIKDSGIGIAPEKQKEIFKAFKQAEDNTQNIYGGTGLGLAICAGYVQEMGSKLLLDSKLNHGSTFYFDLPMDIKEYAHQFEPIKNNRTTIAILMDTANSIVANHMARYLVKIGVNVDQIVAITHPSQISKNITHLICFENKLSDTYFTLIKNRKIKSLVIEENFLSLDAQTLHGSILASQYTYYGESLYSLISEDTIPRVLIVEDDHISIILLKSILENEYCEVDIAHNGKEGFNFLIAALQESKPYNIVYTDHNMPLLSGGTMLQEYKKVEALHSQTKTLTVSISGDTKRSAEYAYDYFAIKPFRKKDIISHFLKTI